MRSRRARRGFSLLEVLLALAILLLALTAIGQLVDMGSDRELDGRLQTQASRLIQAKLGEFESGAAPLESGSGSFEGDDAGWTWTASVEPQSTPNLYLVKISASRDLKGKAVTIEMSQMILDPAALGTAAEAVRPDGVSGELP
jgi:prepilin-type N-terminal cleavage/methylation domain-containing protein